jgi:hypothetical protein
MGNRIAPDGGTRFSYALLAFVLVASLVQVVGTASPALGLAGDTGPAVIPFTDISALQDADREWDTKNQHRVWWNSSASRWDAILPAATTAAGGPAATASDWWIAKGAVPTAPGDPAPEYQLMVNDHPVNRPDVFWDDTANRLYVLFSGPNPSTFYEFEYSGGNYSLAQGPITVPDFDTSASRASIHMSDNGVLWAAMMDGGGLYVTRSTDGSDWAAPVRLLFPVDEGQVAITNIGPNLAIAAAENGDNPRPVGRNPGYHFYTIADNDATWDQVTSATGTLTFTVQPNLNDTISVDGTIYTFVNTLTAASNEVLIGATPEATLDNLVLATWGGPGSGTVYSTATKPHPTVVFEDRSGTSSNLFAAFTGEDGNGLVTVGTGMLATGAFGAGELAGGASPWTRETITLTSASGLAHADDELSLVKDGSNNVYIATETDKGTTGDPQVVVLRRASGGGWTQHLVRSKSGGPSTDRKRPVIGISGSTVYVISTNNGLWESGYQTASLTTLETPGSPFSATLHPLIKTGANAADPVNEFVRNHIVPRFATGAEGLPVLFDNLGDLTIWQTKLPSPNNNNQPPGVYAGENKTVAQSPATALNGVVTNIDGPTTTSLWTKISGPGNVAFSNAASPTSTATFSALGVYVLRLTATESGTDPLVNRDEVQITVQPINNPPTLTVSKPTNNQSFAQGATVTFQASAIDPEEGDISKDIVWTSSRDGQLGIGPLITRNNLSSGTHTITARINDGQNTVTVTRTITIGTSGGGGGVNPFVDAQGHLFENAIIWLAEKGITQGCNPPTNNRFCPDDPVTRGEMAVFLVRAFGYSDNGGGNLFVDDNGLFYENSADRLFTAGVTQGCNPPTNNRYCGEQTVTRGQMAAFLARAFNLPAYNGPDRFRDDDGNIFEGAIERLAQAGITVGCNPPNNDRFCPDSPVTRGQMATFLKRAFGE